MEIKQTKILKITKNADTLDDLEKLKYASDVIKKGGLVVFPTETVYGLGANALDQNASQNIYLAKGRPQNNPLIIHLNDKSDIQKYCHTDKVSGLEKVLSIMPAPLTVILPAKDCIPKTVTGGLDTVAVRVPKNAVANKFLSLCGVPVAAPSANLSGKPSPTNASHVIEDMHGRVDVIIDAGSCEVGLESTIITLCEKTPTLLRPGGVSYEELCDLLGEVDLSRAVLESLKPGDTVLSPGMMYKHYAPDKPVFLLKGNRQQAIAYINSLKSKKNAVICYSEDVQQIDNAIVLSAGTIKDNKEYASRLFSLLRETNSIDADTVYAFLPQDTKGISLAIYNRLLRAATFNIIEV